MVYYWDRVKNEKLISRRGISFEEIVLAIEDEKILDEVEHPNETKYKNQKMYIVELNNYAYLVPFVQDKEHIFLKTIIPSRKATRKYLRRPDNENI